MKNCSTLLFVLTVSGSLLGMEELTIAPLPSSGGPMNALWFYHPYNSYKKEANDAYQKRQWHDAELAYKKLLKAGSGTEYDKNMANVNLASCEMAQRKASEGWASFDALIDIPQEKRISKDMIDSGLLSGKLVRVKTNIVGIGDISHFSEVAHILQERTGCYVMFEVRDFLKDTFRCIAQAYSFGLEVESCGQKTPCDYETHIIGLLGHLKIDPAQTAPERVILTAPERAMVVVAQQIDPLLAQGKKLAMVYIGDKRRATLIGGKLLPLDETKHGRNLDSAPFKQLLRNHQDLVLVDCGDEEKGSAVLVDKDQLDRYIKIAPEEQAFDTLIALASLMNMRKAIVGFGADNGPTNVFTRALDREAQRRMALIIPNGSKDNGEYDMRMEGEGSAYTQMISNCCVYECETPADQIKVVEKAYQDMSINFTYEDLDLLRHYAEHL